MHILAELILSNLVIDRQWIESGLPARAEGILMRIMNTHSVHLIAHPLTLFIVVEALSSGRRRRWVVNHVRVLALEMLLLLIALTTAKIIWHKLGRRLGRCLY